MLTTPVSAHSNQNCITLIIYSERSALFPSYEIVPIRKILLRDEYFGKTKNKRFRFEYLDHNLIIAKYYISIDD